MDKMTLKRGAAESISPFWEALVLPLLKYKKMIYAITATSVLATLAVCLLLKNQYTSTAVILPSGGGGLSSELKDLAAGSLGELNLGAANQAPENSSALFPSVLASRLVSERILARAYSFYDGDRAMRLSMADYIEALNADRAIMKLKQLVAIDTDRKTGVIRLSVTTEYPELSAAVARAYLEELDDYNIHHRQSTASENEKFTSKRLEEIKTELGAAEDSLRFFKASNMNYLTGSDPGLQLALSRLQRDVDLMASLYLTMAQQNEMARIEAAKDIPVVQVLDYGQVPSEKSSPRRSVYLAGALLGSFFFSCLLALWLDLSVKRGHGGQLRRVVSSPEVRMNRLESRIAGRLTRIADLIEKKQS